MNKTTSNEFYIRLGRMLKSVRRQKHLSYEQASMITGFRPEKLQLLEQGHPHRWSIIPLQNVRTLFAEYDYELSVAAHPVPRKEPLEEAAFPEE